MAPDRQHSLAWAAHKLLTLCICVCTPSCLPHLPLFLHYQYNLECNYHVMVDHANCIWSVSNLQRNFIVRWLIRLYFCIFSHMIDSTKIPASVGLAQARFDHLTLAVSE